MTASYVVAICPECGAQQPLNGGEAHFSVWGGRCPNEGKVWVVKESMVHAGLYDHLSSRLDIVQTGLEKRSRGMGAVFFLAGVGIGSILVYAGKAVGL